MLFSGGTYDENVFIRYRYQYPRRAMTVVRDGLRAESGFSDIPGAEYIGGRYRAFKRDLPNIARLAHLNPANLTYVDYCFVISEWLKANARA